MRGASGWGGLQKEEPVDAKHDFYQAIICKMTQK